jgi:hypothetical protein
MALEQIPATPKIGDERLTFNEKNVGYTLLEFWQWSVSDLLSNAARGRFAEFVVGTALGINCKKLRHEWALYDLISNNGIKIEVKSAAYIQTWHQTKFSPISFSIKPTIGLDEKTGEIGKEPKRRADVYVFALLKTKDLTIDPLKMEQWEFYVVPTYKLDNYSKNQGIISLKPLQKLANAVRYDQLKSAIESCHAEQMQQIKTE